MACWMVTGERQAARIRNLYLKAILRQEIGFFDKETNTGEVVGRMSGDTALMIDAMGEKVCIFPLSLSVFPSKEFLKDVGGFFQAGKFIQLVATFVGGLVVAFSQGWLLTLVMLCSIPPLVAAGSAMAIFMTKLASHGQAAYAEASAVVEHTIGAIRTVSRCMDRWMDIAIVMIITSSFSSASAFSLQRFFFDFLVTLRLLSTSS